MMTMRHAVTRRDAVRALSRGPRRQTRVVSASLGRRDMRDDDVLASARRSLDDADGTESSTSSRGDAALEATTRVTGEGFHRVVDVRVSGVERVDDAIAVAVDVRLSRRLYFDADEDDATDEEYEDKGGEIGGMDVRRERRRRRRTDGEICVGISRDVRENVDEEETLGRATRARSPRTRIRRRDAGRRRAGGDGGRCSSDGDEEGWIVDEREVEGDR